MGTMSMNEWDTFVKTVTNLGIDHCIAVKQAAYDRYESK